MQSARLMLAHIGEREASQRLQKGIEAVYADGTKLTGDLGGKASTEEFTNAVIAAL
jgi:isocitrate/isopropylmalate dehydrogenase